MKKYKNRKKSFCPLLYIRQNLDISKKNGDIKYARM